MRAKEYLKDTIKNLVSKFEEIKCSYKFDTITETHYIEILPSEFFAQSEELTMFRADIFDDFDETYTDQGLVFITDTSLTQISDPDFSMEGKKYKNLMPELLWIERLSALTASRFNDVSVVAGENNYALAA